MHRCCFCGLTLLVATIAGCRPGLVPLPTGGTLAANPNVTPEKFDQLDEGMSQAQVEQILGRGVPASAAEIDRIQFPAGDIAARHNYKLNETAHEGRCYLWRNAPLYIFIVYDQPPAKGGKLYYAELDHFIESPGGAREFRNLAMKGLLWSDG